MEKKIVLGICFGLLAASCARGASAASLSLSPASGNYAVGYTFTVAVAVSSPDAAMNAAQGTISFPADKLSVISLSKTNSIVNLWVQDPSFSNRDGTINFGGVVVNPGFQGANGRIITITFQVKNPGSAAVSFISGSVLANDGKGTNILSGMQGATFTLAATPSAGTVSKSGFAVFSDPSTADGEWYSLDAIMFKWSLPADADGVSYAISNDPGYQLPKSPQGSATNVSYDLTQLADGVWYFYASYESGGVWGPVATLILQLDRTPPDPFAIVQKNTGAPASDPNPVFTWTATDKTSGVAYYRAKIGDGDWFDPATVAQDAGYVLPVQSPTDARALTVRAYDRAGNYREESTTFHIAESCAAGINWCSAKAFISNWLWAIALVIALCLAAAYWLIYRVFRWRARFHRELAQFKEELRRDLRHIEEYVNTNVGKGKEVDLRPSHLEAEKKTLEKAVEHLEEDVKEEIKKIERM